MRDSWRMARIGEFATQAADRHRVEPDAEYVVAGVLNKGAGLFTRDTIRGSETNYPDLIRLKADQLVMRKLTAWEGPITVVPDEFEGCFVSSEFPTFDLDRSRVEPGFIRLICQQPSFWDSMRLRVKGTVQRRKRLNPADLLGIEVQLPPLGEQRRIVSVLVACDHAIDRNLREQTAVTQLRSALLAELLAPREGWLATTLGEAAEVTIGRQRSPGHASGDHMVRYLRAANVKDGRLLLDDVLTMNFSPVEQERFGLRAGDVLVTEGCGSLRELGASGVWEEQIGGIVCFQNTLLRIRSRYGLTLPGFIEQWARNAHATGQFAAVSSGTNIFHIGLRRAHAMPIALPSLDDQARIVDLMSSVGGQAVALDAVRSRAARLRAALLDELLSGAHEIPESYDALLTEAASA